MCHGSSSYRHRALHLLDVLCCRQRYSPPLIRGYRQEYGHNTNKIMRILNAMYARMTEINGAEPMPAEVFKERKRIINEFSRM